MLFFYVFTSIIVMGRSSNVSLQIATKHAVFYFVFFSS